MPITLIKPQVSSTRSETQQDIAAEANAFMVFCPSCGTLETVWFTKDGLIVPTRKFSQYGARLYHDCGSDISGHLYRTS